MGSVEDLDCLRRAAGIPFRQIANLIGRHLHVPVVSKAPAEAAKQFGFLAPFIPMDNPTSSRLTQE
jgi:hypothetical protein